MISRFEDFAGNADVVKSARNMVVCRRIPQLIVIEGQEGSGRGTLAGLIAAGAVCSGENPPCLNCTNCLKVKTGHPDIIAVNPNRSEKSIGVDFIRSVISDAYILANEAAYKVYLVSEAHKMTPQAQNAMLKVLEESPERVVFIFTCTSRNALLQTVLSRAVVLTLSAVSAGEAVDVLQKMYPEKGRDAVYSAAVKSGRIIGKAAELLSGAQDKARTFAVLAVKAVSERKESGFLSALAPCEKDRELLLKTFGIMTDIFRDAYTSKLGFEADINKESAELVLSLKRLYTAAALKDMVENTVFICGQTRNNVSQSLLITALSSRIF